MRLLTILASKTRWIGIGFTPFYLLHGYEAGMPTDFQDETASRYARNLRKQWMDARNIAKESIEIAQAKAKERYDKRRSIIEFKEGDWVLIRDMARKIGVCEKLRPLFIGPFQVKKQIGENVYEIIKENGNTDLISIERMVKYNNEKEARKSKRKIQHPKRFDDFI